ncbi:hypothetical protein U1Q18_008916 [Sarracenia purpurea var. burkii]
MYGEGNLLAHLAIVGYKVSYQQSPLNEYDFTVTDLFEDLRDGVRLCRAIQLLQHDASILMKIVVPSDTHKKNMVNCGIAMQHLKQVGVPLFDEDGTIIVEEDIVSGDKELTLSLLWNIFVHLQEDLYNSTLLDMLLNWIQAICEGYDFTVDNFASLFDGKAMWCLLDYYFRKELNCSCSLKDIRGTSGGTSIMSVGDYTDAVHNFILSQKLPTLLGNFPEVLQVSDILEHNGACNSRSVVILLGFLSFQLIIRKNTDQLNFHKLLGFSCQSPEKKYVSPEQCFVHSQAVLNQEDRHGNINEDGIRNFKAIMAWWQDMALQSKRFDKQSGSPLQCLPTSPGSNSMERENAAKIIQSHFRRSMKHRDYLHIRNAVLFLQTVIRAWLAVKNKLPITKFCTSRVQELSCERRKHLEVLDRYFTFMIDRHNFIKLRRSVEIIQHATRAWITRIHHDGSILTKGTSSGDVVQAAIVVQKCIRGWKARSTYFQWVSQLEKTSLAREENEANELQIKAASTIQLAWKKFLLWKSLGCQHLAATTIQSNEANELHLEKTSLAREENEANELQIKAASTIQLAWKKFLLWKSLGCRHLAATTIQSNEANELHLEKTSLAREENESNELQIKAASTIQLAWKKFLLWKSLGCQHLAATTIQSNEANELQIKAACTIQLSWKKFLMYKSNRCQRLAATKIRSCYLGWFMRKKFVNQKQATVKIQSVFRSMKCLRDIQQYKLASRSVIIVQSHIRGWIARRGIHRLKCMVVVIQVSLVALQITFGMLIFFWVEISKPS